MVHEAQSPQSSFAVAASDGCETGFYGLQADKRLDCEVGDDDWRIWRGMLDFDEALIAGDFTAFEQRGLWFLDSLCRRGGWIENCEKRIRGLLLAITAKGNCGGGLDPGFFALKGFL